MLKKFWTYWLQHFVVIWLFINIYNAVDYAHKLSIWGPMTLNPDGTPISVWQMLVIHNFHRPDYLYLAVVTLLTELNYRFIFKRRHLAFFAGGALLIGAVCTFAVQLFDTGKYPSNFFEPMAAITGYALFYGLVREFFYQRLYKLKLRADASEMQLNSLKQQLNPHFLFNTLNYLYGTALQENAERTAEGIDRVASMMRYTVTGVQETFVPLNEEVAFIQNYLQLQQVRVSGDVRQEIRIDVNVPQSGLKIAPLILLPFIENAFKYGISTDHASRIEITILQEGTELKADIKNTIITRREEIKGTGSGIKLSKERLQLLYPDKHLLSITQDKSTYHVSLNFQLQ